MTPVSNVSVEATEDRIKFFAKCVHEAISGIGTNERLLDHVLVRRSAREIKKIKEMYRSDYGESLKDAIVVG